MRRFPEFVNHPADQVANGPTDTMEGVVFDGESKMQVILWQCEKGGEVPEHSHDYWEYCVVLDGTCDCNVDGKLIRLGPGDECAIPPGIKHSGRFSPGYRAIDVFGAKRVDRVKS